MASPAVAYMGPDGAGHYVKMVHNGIEYGDMQLICEAYAILKNVLGLEAKISPISSHSGIAARSKQLSHRDHRGNLSANEIPIPANRWSMSFSIRPAKKGPDFGLCNPP